MLLREWLDSWREGRSDRQPASRERARVIVEIHIKPKLGQYPLDALDALDQQAIQKWAGGPSSSQVTSGVRKIVDVLFSSLQIAVIDGRLPAKTTFGLTPPIFGKPAKRHLNRELVRDLADTVDLLGEGTYQGEPKGYRPLVKILDYC